MNSIGSSLKVLRKSKNMILREVAAAICIDPTLLSKIERNERLPTKQQIIALTEFFMCDDDMLMVEWLSDKLLSDIVDEEHALRAMEMAIKKIQVLRNTF